MSDAPFELVVGFDAEWVNANRADDSLPASDNIILSYQLALINPANNKREAYLFRVKGKTKRARFALSAMLEKALRKAFGSGVIEVLPAVFHITVVGHFLRADVSALRDFEKLKRRIDGVRKTFTTVTRPVKMRLMGREATIYFADTMLLSPQHSPLKKLGEVIGRPKIELPAGAIERMDRLLEDDSELFQKYALEDAIIAALYYLKVSDVLARDLGVTDWVPTLGSAGVKMIVAALVELDITPDHYFGYERRGRKRHWLPCLADVLPFAANSYHGARNEAYYIGLTPAGIRLYDLDLKGAYTTAMAMMRVPDWNSVRATTDLGRLAVVDEAMTFARVRFEFPVDTRFPSLPVRAGARGLVYPLRGVSWCGGPELLVALAQGAKITVEAGWRVDWMSGSCRPFEAFTRRIADIRKRAKSAGDTLLDQTAKEIGNSAYGKIAQAVDTMRSVQDGGVDATRGKRVFDTRTQSMKTLPPSVLSG